MKNSVLILLFLSAWGAAYAEDSIPAHPHIRVETTQGTFVFELEGRRAPLTVRNFLSLVDSGHYDGTIFHRVMPGFMIQGGGYTPDLNARESTYIIPNESGNGLSNTYGTIAMARTSNPHSASDQFFVNMEVVDKIAISRTGPAGRFKKDVPIVPVVIKKMSRVVYDD
jgi:cyclophilin family peptidyl-prolyl cis-trans isomerase